MAALAACICIANCTFIGRASVGNDGLLPFWDSTNVTISGGGRYTVFQSLDEMGNEDDGNTIRNWDIFLRDHQLGITERISVNTTGGVTFGDNVFPVVSDDGRFVAFRSGSSTLVANDINGTFDVFVRDRQLNMTELVSVDSDENQSFGDGVLGLPRRHLAITPDGRYVAFASISRNLVPDDADNNYDVFVRDRQLGTTEIVCIDSDGNHTITFCREPSISDSGRYVAFSTFAAWDTSDDNGTSDIYLRDRLANSTSRISTHTVATGQPDGASFNPSLSADGRYVAFESASPNIVTNDTNGKVDIFLRDRFFGFTRLVSTPTGGGQANGDSTLPTVSNDGRYVAFLSEATNLVSGDTNGVADMFVKDLLSQRTFRVSTKQGGQQNLAPVEVEPGAAMSNDGRYVAFETEGALATTDTNARADAYIKYALEPGPLSGGGLVSPGSSATVQLTSAGWLDPANLGARVIPADGITIDAVNYTGFSGSYTMEIEITVAPGAVAGPRDIAAWNNGTLGLATGSAALCEGCLVIN